ncbi:vWA domain-containing protein [Botrimarina mediterranea]|uniref:VWFA domain-containing protein n=1 Tax=Botrimarina mediterranea TaxID=2528022 RepID=A0A518K9S2_9BACT|nr:hypothetical protein [Botrimarina mediterranea]QDV74545.1 hypothetical protein Spa11_27490 [Botrimarina mediterranea]QDV79185.1 hypothetical protein K2D_27960 [Planctomycetes bacterium K2D]
MSPKNFLHSLRQTLTPPSGANALVPVSKYDGPPLLSGQVSLSLLVDTSPSLDEYIQRVREGAQQFVDQVRTDAWLRERVAVSVWSLADSRPAALMADWVPASQLKIPELPRCGHTPLCGAISQTLDHAVARGASLSRERHCDQAMNLVFVMSDFLPTDAQDQQALMESSLRQAAEAGVLLFPLTVGDVDKNFAESVAQPGRPPLALDSVDDFTTFFKALRRSLRRHSMSMPGAPLQLEYRGCSLRLDR